MAATGIRRVGGAAVAFAGIAVAEVAVLGWYWTGETTEVTVTCVTAVLLGAVAIASGTVIYRGRAVMLPLVILLVSALMADFAFMRRLQVAAKVWHWTHGSSLRVAGYEFPVPEQWLVLNQSSTLVMLIDTAPTIPDEKKFHAAATVTFLLPSSTSSAVTTDRLNFWANHERQWLESQGISASEQTLRMGSLEAMTCIGGKELATILKPKGLQSDVVSMTCMSDRGLTVLFVGEPSDVQRLYALASQVQRYQ